MLSAFKVHPVIELKPRDKSKIESILAYGDRVVVGLATGALRIYRVNETDPSLNEIELAECLRDEEKFSKRTVLQLAIVKEANLLVSLSDAVVSLHRLSDYTLQEKLDKTKGATAFAVTSDVVKDPESDVPTLVSRLAVAVKRRILLWVWQDMELAPQAQEISMPATVKTLTWLSTSSIVVGMDPGFSLVDLDTQDITEINKPAVVGDTTGQGGGLRFGAVNTTGMGYVGLSGWVPRPMATRLADGQVLLAKDVNTLFIDDTGRPLDKRQIPWSFPPDALNYSYPYVLSLQPPTKGALDVRNPDSSTLLQTISVPGASILHVPQPNISLAHAGKGFFVASDRCVWRMVAVPYEQQVDQLLEKSCYDEAISLLALLKHTLLKDKQGLLREVQMRKAQALFEHRKYRPALDLFADAGAPPAKVIALYPTIIAGEVSGMSSNDDLMKPQDDDMTRTDGENLAATQLKETHAAILSSSSEDGPDPASIDDAASIVEAARAESIAPEDLKTAVLALCSFLAQSRVQVQKYIHNDGTLKSPVPVDQHSDAYSVPFRNLIPFDRGTDYTKVDWQGELHRVANLVDTTLFRAYMLSLPSLAGPLFRLENFCDPHVVEAKLYESGRYNDLIDFLHGKKLHREALEVLQKFGRDDAAEEVMPALRGPARTVHYLKELPAEYIDLILEFAKWPLQAQSDLGMDVFLADTDNAERLPRERVLRFLESVDHGLATTYLEHIVQELNDQNPDFHQKLVDKYISALQASTSELSGTARKKSQTRLQTFLRQSKHYNKGKTIRQLPLKSSDFYESRAIVLSAMGNHKQALTIYVFDMTDYAKAEEYCNDVFLTTKDSDDNMESIYTTLLSLYLQPPSPHTVNWPPALDLLSNHGARLPAAETLGLTPDGLRIWELEAYFRDRIRSDNSALNTARIVGGLEAARRARIERRLAALDAEDEGRKRPRTGRARHVVVNEDSHCKVCLRRFGNSAIRVYPDNHIVHYGCVGREQGT